jgi:uncharacterized protein YjiS (DUF1127 family)
MRHDVKIRRRGFRQTVDTICQYLRRWRNAREARRSLAEIARRKSRYLLDDMGLDRMDTGCRRDPALGVERHRFWML